MILDIIKYDDSNSGKLRKINVDVKKENPFLISLIKDMFETLNYHNFEFGLSAPQVGHNLNLFVINNPDLKEVFINPEIKLDGFLIQNKEKCLSFPNLEFPINRRSIVHIKYYDINWNYKLSTFKDLNAIAIQHQFDHINGKLII
jgi:peptide deformylase